MACGDNLVVGVLRTGSVDRVQDVGLCLEPGVPETSRGVAVAADGCRNVGELDIGDPIADRARAAEGNDNELVRCIDCDEASDVRSDRAARR